MKIGIFGLPNSGKSQLRRHLVAHLRQLGHTVEHWDADRFEKARCPEDEDMKEPPETFDAKTIWLIEDVRGTVILDAVRSSIAVMLGRRDGAWRPIPYYDQILYLAPDWPTYAAFWVSRALQWHKNGKGDWTREKGWENLGEEEAILKKTQRYLLRREEWMRADREVLPPYTQFVVPYLDKDAQDVVWRGLDSGDGTLATLMKRG